MLWWIKHIVVCILSGFFILFGIQVFIVAFKLKNPYEFVMCFASSNLIILIGATFFFGFIYRMFRYRKDKENNDEN